MSKAAANTWKRESGFIWSMMGSAIGFANLLSFSAQCYANGGGAFMLPFVVAILVLGLPMLFLEGTVGHRMKAPIVTAFGRSAGRPGRIFGWLSIAAVATIGAFYIVLTGYSLAYAYFSGVGSIPTDTATFFKSEFLGDSGSLLRLGAFSWPIFLSMIGVALFSWYVLEHSIRSGVERICSIFLPLLCGLTALFALVVCFLPGAWTGFTYFLRPDFSKLLEPALWRDVFGQVFFSFSLGLGIVTGYSLHTGKTTSIPRAMWYVAMGDLVVSLVAGFAIFGCIGYLSHTTGVPFPEIVRSDSSFEIGFVIFPKILHAFGPMLSRVVGVVFFFCVFIAGITGLFSIVESILGNIQSEFRRSRRASATWAIVLIASLATLFCFGNGQSLIGALAPMVLGKNMLIGGLALVAIFMYRERLVRDDAIWFRGERRTIPYTLLRYAVPVILLTILAASVRTEFQGGVTLEKWVRWGWLTAALTLSAALSLRPEPVPYTEAPAS